MRQHGQCVGNMAKGVVIFKQQGGGGISPLGRAFTSFQQKRIHVNYYMQKGVHANNYQPLGVAGKRKLIFFSNFRSDFHPRRCQKVTTPS